MISDFVIRFLGLNPQLVLRAMAQAGQTASNSRPEVEADPEDADEDLFGFRTTIENVDSGEEDLADGSTEMTWGLSVATTVGVGTLSVLSLHGSHPKWDIIALFFVYRFL